MKTLMKWNPFEASLPDMDEFFGPTFMRRHPQWPMETFVPRMGLKETPETYVVTAEIPGIPAEQVRVDLQGNRLTLSGEKKEEVVSEEEHRHVTERRAGSFCRSFTFPSPVDPEGVVAEADKGVLTITVAKSASPNGRRIQVKST